MQIETTGNLLFDSRNERCFIKFLENDQGEVLGYIQAIDNGTALEIEKRYCGAWNNNLDIKENIKNILNSGSKWSHLPD